MKIDDDDGTWTAPLDTGTRGSNTSSQAVGGGDVSVEFRKESQGNEISGSGLRIDNHPASTRSRRPADIWSKSRNEISPRLEQSKSRI